MPDQNALIPQADSAILTNALSGLQDTLFTAAEANIRGYLGDEVAQYSALQMRAMVATEALRLTTGMDLSTIITRGTIIRQIEEEGLVGVLPNGFANLTALAAENGVSVGELSDIRALWDVIFPYITDVLGQNLVEVWEQVGKSKFREMVPALRPLITGENADHNSVRGAVQHKVSETISGIHEVHGNGSYHIENRRFGEIVQELFPIPVCLNIYRYAIKVLNNLFQNMGPFILFIVGGYLAINGRFDLGALVAFLSAYEKLYDPWKELMEFYHEVIPESLPQRDFILRLTARCNMQCPICLASSAALPSFCITRKLIGMSALTQMAAAAPQSLARRQ